MQSTTHESSLPTSNESRHEPVVAQLEALLDSEPSMATALVASLQAANDSARKSLNPDLHAAIDKVFQGNGWPRTINSYLDYLDLYVRLVPNESNDPDYPNAWKSDDESNGYNQKVYDLLCQFYWLVNQPDPTSGDTLQSFDAFAAWLVEFATSWGAFLDTPESLTSETLHSFKYDRMYNYSLYSDNEAQWHTFNKFFYREFNGASPGTGLSPLRPIASPGDNTVIVSPADCTYKMHYQIDDNGNVLDSVGSQAEVNLKHTHSIGTVKELLGDSEYASDFNGGTFVHYFLSPFDYHRFHTPVEGKILEIKALTGKVFLNVNITADGQWDAPDGAENGYEFNQARGLVVVDAGPDVQKVAVLPIGMAQVSGVMMHTQLKGQVAVKGQEFGKFRFGGSDIIMLFQKPPEELYLFTKDPSHNPIHFQYGQTSVYWNKS